MGLHLLSFAQRGAQTPAGPQPSTVLTVTWLIAVGLFIISVFVSGFTAKKINNIHNPTYGKATLAQFLIGLLSLTGFFIFGLFLKAPPLVALGIAYSVIPIIVYRIVFACFWTEAAVLWIVTTLVQAAIGYGLLLAGLISLSALTG